VKLADVIVGCYSGTPPTAVAIREEIDSNSTQLAAIVADTDELQTNQGDWATATGFMADTEDGSSFTAIPWNAAWDAEVQSECADAITAAGVSTHAPADVKTAIEAAGSSLAQILEDTGTDLPAAIAALQTDVDFIRAIEGGRWVRQENEMVFYGEDNVTEVARFNLLTSGGAAAGDDDDVFERTRA